MGLVRDTFIPVAGDRSRSPVMACALKAEHRLVNRTAFLALANRQNCEALVHEVVFREQGAQESRGGTSILHRITSDQGNRVPAVCGSEHPLNSLTQFRLPVRPQQIGGHAQRMVWCS